MSCPTPHLWRLTPLVFFSVLLAMDFFPRL